MRVAMIAGALPDYPCGVGDYSYRLCNALSKNGIEVAVFTSKIKELNFRLFNFKAFPLMDGWLLSEVKPLIKEIRSFNPDIIHIQYPGRQYSSRAVYFLPLIFQLYFPQKKIIITLHEFSFVTGFLRYKHLFSAICADAVIVVNSFYSQDICKIAPWMHKKIYHVRIGPGILPFGKNINHSSLRESLGVSKNDVLLSYFGFVNPDKGIDDLIKSLGKLNAGFAFKLLLIGEKAFNSEYHKYLDRLIQEENLQGKVIWTGYVTPEEVSQYLQVTDIAVFPFTEGVCEKRSSLHTAVAHGLPTVTTLNHRITPEFYHNLLPLAKPGNPDSLAEVLGNLMASQELRNKYSLLAQELTKYYSWDIIADETIKVYHETLRK